ncbi:hypothetical protein AYI69_g3340 [Smittium culicis]|uniref:Uncharacterized protein n=1 Tax=Smittium culicis TaxID=133412 RepID=A0A1R1YJZ4_9FUNG|nr:hypothetical protein AYI69_g3340 [Smittium culicis]
MDEPQSEVTSYAGVAKKYSTMRISVKNHIYGDLFQSPVAMMSQFGCDERLVIDLAKFQDNSDEVAVDNTSTKKRIHGKANNIYNILNDENDILLSVPNNNNTISSNTDEDVAQTEQDLSTITDLNVAKLKFNKQSGSNSIEMNLPAVDHGFEPNFYINKQKIRTRYYDLKRNVMNYQS